MKRTLLAAALVLLVADVSYGQTCQAVINGAKARISIQQPKWADARQVLAENLAGCQDLPEFHYLYAITLARVSNDSIPKAVGHLWAADSLNGDPAEGDELQANISQALIALWGPIVNEGVRLLQAGDLDKARERLEFAAQINPEGKEARLALGATYQSQNEFDKAIEQLRKALEIDPAYKQAFLRLGQTYQLKADAYAGSGDSAKAAQAMEIAGEAVEIYEEYLEQNPGDADVQVQLAGLYATLGQLDKAEPIIRQISGSDSVSAATLTDFGFRLANAQQYDLADQLLSRAVSLTDSLDSEPISYLVFVRIQKSDLPGAKAVLLKQIELEPSNAEAWEYLGLVERDLGNTAAAQEALEKAEGIPLALESLRVGQDADRTVNVQATFSNRTETPLQGVTVRFSLISGSQVLETKDVTIASAQALPAGEAESVTVEFDKPADTPRVMYEIVT
jgi:Tfp pilus assembly protein PilF